MISIVNIADLLLHLRIRRVTRSGDLLEYLRKERPSMSRATMLRYLKTMGNQIVKGGAASKTAYAVRRAIRGNADPIPLYQIDENGHGTQVSTLDPIYPNGCLLPATTDWPWPLDKDMQDGWYGGMPYFLDDMRPQGFLGRNFAHAYAAMFQVDEDPTKWKEDDVLAVLSALGSDTQGNWILGEAAYRRYLARFQEGDEILDEKNVLDSYADLAEKAMAHGVANTSAGGEFPKFTACCQKAGGPVHVIVKFSGNDDTPGVRRWSDLLICEHLALTTINQCFPFIAATSSILQGAGRTYLEVERFDRHGQFGRSAVCTWHAIETAMFGMGGTWIEGAARLLKSGMITAIDVEHITVLFLFGKLIANSDMHDGNLAFRPAPGGAMFELAPAFDMLPMRYAPTVGVELPVREFKVELPLPKEKSSWMMAAEAAVTFWHNAANDERISEKFRKICAQNGDLVTLAKLSLFSPR